MSENTNLHAEQEKIINELRERILNERLHNIQISITRVEEVGRKTYDQARATNGRLTRLEDADTVKRLEALEQDLAPVRDILKNKRFFFTILSVFLIGMIVLVLSQLGVDLKIF
jgi:hypothetical protein